MSARCRSAGLLLYGALQLVGLLKVSSLPYNPLNQNQCHNPSTEQYDEAIHKCCSLCPPGSRVLEKCTENADTKCGACDEGTYTDVWSTAGLCFSCSPSCKTGLVQTKECTRTQDRVCQCPPHHFCQLALSGTCRWCKLYQQCQKGYGVATPGTEKSDVECVPCGPGTFSDVESHSASCRPHRICESEITPGNSTHDAVCNDPGAPVVTMATLLHTTVTEKTRLVTTSPTGKSQEVRQQPPADVSQIAGLVAGVACAVFALIGGTCACFALRKKGHLYVLPFVKEKQVSDSLFSNIKENFVFSSPAIPSMDTPPCVPQPASVGSSNVPLQIPTALGHRVHEASTILITHNTPDMVLLMENHVNIPKCLGPFSCPENASPNWPQDTNAQQQEEQNLLQVSASSSGSLDSPLASEKSSGVSSEGTLSTDTERTQQRSSPSNTCVHHSGANSSKKSKSTRWKDGVIVCAVIKTISANTFFQNLATFQPPNFSPAMCDYMYRPHGSPSNTVKMHKGELLWSKVPAINWFCLLIFLITEQSSSGGTHVNVSCTVSICNASDHSLPFQLLNGLGAADSRDCALAEDLPLSKEESALKKESGAQIAEEVEDNMDAIDHSMGKALPLSIQDVGMKAT
ncbi:tumor necrosis factor receptor superfamily member 1B-like [Lacerta agilis]|uniref:tumor necrosis factor receptor superfamily member 1B-like n=1 Tax=Lacerta agilis TaxID=80427 RepID=UPI00141A07B2|nr:tumor necrosis factor receptor superfamily member 1B-like [Lacerta agilis]